MATMSNKDTQVGSWEVMKGKAKKIWGELTDDDFLKAEGSHDKLIGRIHEKFGEAKEAIKQKLESFNLSDHGKKP